MKDNLDRVVYRTRGGMLSVNELRLLAEAATAQGTGRLFATERQEIVLSGLGLNQARRLLGQPPDDVLCPWPIASVPNIVTTAPVAGMDSACGWLNEGAFDDLLKGFTVSPRRSVALADPMQPYLPAFLGEITFLAMPERDHWRVRLALRELAEEWFLPGAIRSKDIPDAVHTVERCMNSCDVNDSGVVMRTLMEALERYRLPAPGPAAYSVDRYHPAPGALPVEIPEDGIRSDFCVDLCVWAARRSGVSFGLTPWRTLLVRGVSESGMSELRTLLLARKVAETRGLRRRYFLSAVPDDVAQLCDKLDKACPVDLGVAIGVVPGAAPAPDVHIVLRKAKDKTLLDRLRGPRYSVERRESRDARGGRWIRIAEEIHRRDLCRAVVGAIEALAVPIADASANTAPSVEAAPVTIANPAHACRSCMNEYDAAYGDPVGAIAAGVEFDALPADWLCPGCGGSKADYEITAAV